jgi:hypothetical protein
MRQKKARQDNARRQNNARHEKTKTAFVPRVFISERRTCGMVDECDLPVLKFKATRLVYTFSFRRAIGPPLTSALVPAAVHGLFIQTCKKDETRKTKEKDQDLRQMCELKYRYRRQYQSSFMCSSLGRVY